MNPVTSFESLNRAPSDRSSVAWAAIIAILFALFAALSFAVDQSVTL